RRTVHERAVALGELDHLQGDAVLRRPAGILTLELGPDANVGVRRQRVHADERRVADESENVVVPSHDPPATAGSIDSTSPSSILVSGASRYRMSSSSLYTLTNLCKPPASSSRFARSPGYCSIRLLNTSPTVAPSTSTVA